MSDEPKSEVELCVSHARLQARVKELEGLPHKWYEERGDHYDVDSCCLHLETAEALGVEIPRCPECGYTAKDAAIHMDHHLCKGTIPQEPDNAQ